MITYKETIEGILSDGLTWRIEQEHPNLNLYLTILWANGEEIESWELGSQDIERLCDLFLQARGVYGAIPPSKRGKK